MNRSSEEPPPNDSDGQAAEPELEPEATADHGKMWVASSSESEDFGDAQGADLNGKWDVEIVGEEVAMNGWGKKPDIRYVHLTFSFPFRFVCSFQQRSPRCLLNLSCFLRRYEACLLCFILNGSWFLKCLSISITMAQTITGSVEEVDTGGRHKCDVDERALTRA